MPACIFLSPEHSKKNKKVSIMSGDRFGLSNEAPRASWWLCFYSSFLSLPETRMAGSLTCREQTQHYHIFIEQSLQVTLWERHPGPEMTSIMELRSLASFCIRRGAGAAGSVCSRGIRAEAAVEGRPGQGPRDSCFLRGILLPPKRPNRVPIKDKPLPWQVYTYSWDEATDSFFM